LLQKRKKYYSPLLRSQRQNVPEANASMQIKASSEPCWRQRVIQKDKPSHAEQSLDADATLRSQKTWHAEKRDENTYE